MKAVKFSAILLAHLFLITALPVLAGSDDFNDDLRDPAKWGGDIFLEEGSDVALTEIRGHLEFTGSTDGEGDNTVLRPWIGDVASYTQNWEASVDLHIGALEMLPWSGLQMFLAVAVDGNISNRVVLGQSIDQGENELIEREYEWSSAVANNELSVPPNAGEVSTGDQDGRIRVAFDASTKTLYGSYNGIPIGWVDVDADETSWGMSAGSTFMVVLGGSIWENFDNNGSEVYADNFEFRSGNDLTYELTIGHGSGSGAYTNNSKISITAEAAPSGWEFDRWVGSTQYVSNVSATTTMVSMPAHAIALTPSYTLIGTPSGDDFNDNSKDNDRWGADIQFGSRGVLSETHHRVEFQVSSGTNEEWTAVFRPWRESVGSYDKSWEVSVNAHLGDIPEGPEYLFANLNLAVFKRGDTNGMDGMPANMFNIALDENQDDDGRERGYELTAKVNGESVGFPGAAYLTTADRDGRLKISFDASSKILRASCNGRVLGWLDTDDPATGWDMSDSDVFGFVLIGAIGNNTNAIPSGEMFFDNFEVVGAIIQTDFTYTISDSNVTITGYTGSGGDVTIPDTIEGFPVTVIGDYAFELLPDLTSVTIPDSVIELAEGAFDACSSLTNVVFGANLALIGDFAFWDCEGLTFIMIPDSVTRIGTGAFYACTGLTSIMIPVSVTQIGGYAFGACSGLTGIPVDENNSMYSSVDGIVFDKEQYVLVQYPAGRAGAYTIPEDVTEIGAGAFDTCSGLTNVILGANVTTIADYAFYDCDGLIGIYFYGNAPLLGLDVFSGANNVTVYRVAESDDWPAVPSLWGGRPTALWIPPVNYDADGDGLPDAWEVQYFGDLTKTENPAAICANGINTVMEAYVAGLNPIDPESRFEITNHAKNVIQWNVETGRVYNVYWSTNLLNGFQSLYINYTGGSITDALHSAAGKCFYKIDVRLEP